MGSPSEYQQRSRECFERAQIVSNPTDRGRWLQLAEQWAALSRMPLPKATLYRNKSMWRSEPPSSSQSLGTPHALPFMKNAPPVGNRRG
jgi:hypothetical protein